MAGRVFARFHVDVGVGDALVGEPERLVGDDFLAFAGTEPASALAISNSQQFAEKLHALTLPRRGRTNTRSKDLFDLLLLVERGALDAAHVISAVTATFERRATHEAPREIPTPPDAWADEFLAMTRDAGVFPITLAQAHQRLGAFWTAIRPQ